MYTCGLHGRAQHARCAVVYTCGLHCRAQHAISQPPRNQHRAKHKIRRPPLPAPAPARMPPQLCTSLWTIRGGCKSALYLSAYLALHKLMHHPAPLPQTNTQRFTQPWLMHTACALTSTLGEAVPPLPSSPTRALTTRLSEALGQSLILSCIAITLSTPFANLPTHEFHTSSSGSNRLAAPVATTTALTCSLLFCCTSRKK